MTPENRKLAFDFALAQMPKEACGVVIVEKGREVFVPCRNESPFNDSFSINPDDYAAAEDRGEIIRIVHSHPYTSPEPSGVDLASCEASGLPWSIVNVPLGQWKDFAPSGYKAPLIGREWAHGLHDCYSLVRDYYRETLGVLIPDYDREFEWWLKGQNLYLDNFKSAGFREVPIEDLKVHDGLLIQIQSPVINHAAVYIGDDKMIHHLHRRLSCRDVFGGYYRKHCIKVVRHENC